MLDTTIQVKTDHFDGPLGLLLLLIQKEEMDVRQLELTKITQQYLDYLAQMKELVAGEYLYLAATLLLLKSKTCISEEETAHLKEQLSGAEDIDIQSQSDLVRRLEELQHFQKMGQKLWARPKKNHDVFVKPKVDRKRIINSILTPIELSKLSEAMMDFLYRENRKYTVVRRDRLSIKEKLQFLKSYLSDGRQTNFDELLEQDGQRDLDNIVITFISLLELARLKRISIFQNEDLGNIYVDVVRSLEDFDVNQADGFEPEEGDDEAEQEDLKEALTKAAEKALEDQGPDTEKTLQ
jgi:segregation and condensation protein A